MLFQSFAKYCILHMADKVGFPATCFQSLFHVAGRGSSLGEKTSAVVGKRDVCYQSLKGKKAAQIANPPVWCFMYCCILLPRARNSSTLWVLLQQCWQSAPCWRRMIVRQGSHMVPGHRSGGIMMRCDF